jgi:4-amino-4-deoxy-L-arabinose transferase-like glycosyltransferase
MLVVALVRLRVADVPLERDEGEYAYAGQLILQGIPPYELAYNMKFPGTYYAFSLIEAVLGQTARGIRVGLLFVNAATTLLVFLLGRRLLGTFGGTISAIAFAILSVDRWTMGVFAHATHFVILPALAGLLLLLRALDSKSVAGFTGAGVLLGVAVLMKQQAVFFMPLAIGLVLWNQNRPRNPRDMVIHSVLVGLGAAIPFAVICAVFVAQGVFDKFWFWTFQYAREYVSEIPISAALGSFMAGWERVTRATLLLWLLATAGLVLLWLVRWTAEVRVFLTGLVLASLLALSPGFYFGPRRYSESLIRSTIDGCLPANSTAVRPRAMPSGANAAKVFS